MNIQQVGIIGAGSRGQEVAEAIAGVGIEVILLDRTEVVLTQAKHSLERLLDQRLNKWGITEAEKKAILSRIKCTTELAELGGCQLLIECVTERIDVKSELMASIEHVVDANTILASNTSTLSLTEIAAKTKHPERMIGLHFLHPPQHHELVEVVRGLQTSDRTFQVAAHFVHTIGKTAIEVYESPGYVTTRLILPLINEASSLLAEGVASIADIDTAMKVGCGFTYGPFEIADQYGLDSVVEMLQSLYEETSDPRYRPTAYLRKLVRAGHVGQNVSRGFYRYDELGNRIEASEGGGASR